MAELLSRTALFGIAVLFFVPALAAATGPEEAGLWRLKHDVEERERQLDRAQCDLAEARARLAQAEGKRDVALAEVRKVVAYHEGQLRWVQKNGGRLCLPLEAFHGARLQLATAKAWLAEMEGKTKELVAELKQVVVYQEAHLQSAQNLLKLRAMSGEEFEEAKKQLDKARKQLAAAENKLKQETPAKARRRDK